MKKNPNFIRSFYINFFIRRNLFILVTILIFILSSVPQVIAQNLTPSNKMSLSEKQENIFLNLAESLYRDGQYTRALSIYLDFIELYPDSSYMMRALETLAELYEKEQRYLDALSVYENLYQRTGPSSNRGIYYYYNQARVLNTMGNVEKAAQIYEDIIKISPDSPYAKKSQINNKLNTLFD